MPQMLTRVLILQELKQNFLPASTSGCTCMRAQFIPRCSDFTVDTLPLKCFLHVGLSQIIYNVFCSENALCCVCVCALCQRNSQPINQMLALKNKQANTVLKKTCMHKTNLNQIISQKSLFFIIIILEDML